MVTITIPPQLLQAVSTLRSAVGPHGWTALALLGTLVLLRLALALVGAVWDRLRSGSGFRRYQGRWAVVTGASYGIGAAYAQELARQGLNVVLVARTVEKMQQVAKTILEKYSSVQIDIVKFDFANANASEWAKLSSKLNALQPAVLVNNVGVNVEMPTLFVEHSDEDIENMIKVNCLATTRMTRALLPGMVERKSGAVVFLSSGSALTPTPMLSVYAATKAFDNHLASTLQVELRGTGVKVQSVTPYFVVSEMSKVRRPSFFIPAAETFVRGACARFGLELRSQPMLSHYLIETVSRLMPKRFVNYVYKHHQDLRRRALRHKERQAEQKKGQ